MKSDDFKCGDVRGRIGGSALTEEMLQIVAELLHASAHVVKAVTFDAHGAHCFFKEALFGYFESVTPEDLVNLNFFREVTYESLPKHALPKLPMSLCRYKGEYIWPLPGSCALFLSKA